jgi:hypothetical protein
MPCHGYPVFSAVFLVAHKRWNGKFTAASYHTAGNKKPMRPKTPKPSRNSKNNPDS